MNLSGHIIVAATAWGQASAALHMASALPDIASIGGFRLTGSSDNADVTVGIAAHHKTDRLFHGHRWFLDLNRDIRAELVGLGVGRGPARAVAHVGVELLLDGHLLAQSAGAQMNSTAFGVLHEIHSDVASLVVDKDQDQWLRYLNKFTDRRAPINLGDPAAVAERLWMILSRRPRLMLDSNHINVVTRSLQAVKPHIDATAEDLVDELAAGLKSGL